MPKALSTHARVIREIHRIMRRKHEIPLAVLHRELEHTLQTKLRVDYLVANLLGQPALVIDCESKTLLKL